MGNAWKRRQTGARSTHVRTVRLFTGHLLITTCVILGLTASYVLATPASGASHARSNPGYSVSPVTEVSTCGVYNAEVEQAVSKPDYVYEAWIG